MMSAKWQDGKKQYKGRFQIVFFESIVLVGDCISYGHRFQLDTYQLGTRLIDP